jgi:phosphatidylserine/phosphatidylglycerophosphate/cardiolipin synthase-like enzyme
MLVGTVNFDNRSFRLNFEITAARAGKLDTQGLELLKQFFNRFAGIVCF